MKNKVTKYYYKEENIEGDFYKIYFGQGTDKIFDWENKIIRRDSIYRYILLSDLEKSEELIKAVKAFENSTPKYGFYTSLSWNDNQRFPFGAYIATNQNLEIQYPIKANMACRKLFKIAKKNDIKLFTHLERDRYLQAKEEQK